MGSSVVANRMYMVVEDSLPCLSEVSKMGFFFLIKRRLLRAGCEHSQRRMMGWGWWRQQREREYWRWPQSWLHGTAGRRSTRWCAAAPSDPFALRSSSPDPSPPPPVAGTTPQTVWRTHCHGHGLHKTLVRITIGNGNPFALLVYS